MDCIHVCVFHSRKTDFKKWLDTSSIPPWHLAICRDSSAVSYRFLDSSSIPSGSIEKSLISSIASQHLVDRSSFCSWIWWVVPRYLLDTLTIDDLFLDTSLDTLAIVNLFLDTSLDTLAIVNLFLDTSLDTFRYLHLSSFTEGLYIHFFAIWFSFLRSLLICPHLFISQTLSLSHSKHLPLWFFKLF